MYKEVERNKKKQTNNICNCNTDRPSTDGNSKHTNTVNTLQWTIIKVVSVKSATKSVGKLCESSISPDFLSAFCSRFFFFFFLALPNEKEGTHAHSHILTYYHVWREMKWMREREKKREFDWNRMRACMQKKTAKYL